MRGAETVSPQEHEPEVGVSSRGPKHLLFINRQFIVGGVETLIARLSKHLLAQGWRVSLHVGRLHADAAH